MSLSKSEAGKLGYLKSKEKFDLVREERANKARQKYEENKKLCLSCSCEISYEKRQNKFCSQSCSATYNNLKKNKKVSICLNCDAELYGKKRTYCSLKCQQGAQRKQRVENKTASHNVVRNYLISINGAKCMDCGWCEVNPYSNKVPIELEHIDGDSSNNELENLKLLCPNCHSLTPTYKSLKKGKGRHERMSRYKQGKSY